MKYLQRFIYIVLVVVIIRTEIIEIETFRPTRHKKSHKIGSYDRLTDSMFGNYKKFNILYLSIDEMEEAEHFIHTEHTEHNNHNINHDNNEIHSTDNIEFPEIHHEIGSKNII
jgi:hypothetical protein